MRDDRESFEDSFETLQGVARLAAERGQAFEMGGNMRFVPGDQDGFNA
jgi:hypothetical protein